MTDDPVVQSLRKQLAMALDRAEKAETIVAALRRTADGVPMVPGGHYWAFCRDRWADFADPLELAEVVWWQGGGDDCFNPEFVLAGENDYGWEFFDVDSVYSNQDAACAATRNETHYRVPERPA